MKCLKCGHHVREVAKFCDECGDPLELSPSERGTRGFADSSARAESDHRLEGTSASSASHFQKSQHFLDMILHAGACLSKTMDLDHYLRVVTAGLAKAMELEAAGVLLYDDHLDDLCPREVWDPERLLIRNATDRAFRIDRAAIDRAFQTGEPVVLGDSTDTTACDKAGQFHAEGTIHNALILPLNTREKTRGLLIFANKKIGRFTGEDIRVGLAVAGVVALSVENADFLEELLDSYRKLVGLERMKSKIMDRVSHELKTPLAVMKGSLRPMENRLKELGMQEFDAAFVRLNRQVQNLDRLEFQVESIMKRGYAEEREMISGFLESAASLIEVQAEQTPEIKRVASMLLRTLEDAFPGNQEQWKRIDVKEFGQAVFEYARGEAGGQGRRLNLTLDLDNGSEVLIPDLVLHATIEGIVRNAVEATPDNGSIAVRGRSNGDFYLFTVEDWGIGIPEEDWGLVFDGFYQVQETENYTSGRPYAFNAGGKGMDLFRIKMFSKIYGFGLYFKSCRCEHLMESLRQCPGSVDRCPYCNSLQDCMDRGGTVFQVEFPVVGRHA